MASFRGLLRKVIKADPLTSKLMKLESAIPGSVGAGLTALTAENVSSNPYKSGEASRHDIFAGGTKLSQDPEARKTGRAVGTAIGMWFGAGAAGAGNTGALSAAAQGAQTSLAVSEGQEAEIQAGIDAENLRRTTEQGLDRLRTALTPKPGTPSAQFDLARRRAEQQDVFRRRKGRRASILTSDRGVGDTPIAQRSLIGS